MRGLAREGLKIFRDGRDKYAQFTLVNISVIQRLLLRNLLVITNHLFKRDDQLLFSKRFV